MSSSDQYTVAWLCPSAIELAAAVGMLDARHSGPAQARNDKNSYRFGSIGKHNIVFAILKSGVPGSISAAESATNLRRTFPKIHIFLLVGVGGGAPAPGNPNTDPRNDIRLGDVVVSNPTSEYGGVVQYDNEKSIQNDRLVLTGILNHPPSVPGTAVATLPGDTILHGYDLQHLVDILCGKYPEGNFHYPGPTADVLFAKDSVHPIGEEDCTKCGNSIQRQPRDRPERPTVHDGLIGSANQVVRDPILRDNLRQKYGIICFEMEAGRLICDYPCLVIRGISNYSDSHKNDQWQAYAAATAAAYAKHLLVNIALEQVAEQGLIGTIFHKNM